MESQKCRIQEQMLPAEKTMMAETAEIQEINDRMPKRTKDLVETEEILNVLRQ